jgi:hypothetical protein
MTRPATYFMLLKATEHWRALDRAAQRDGLDQTLMMVFNGYPALRMSHYESNAPDGHCTDVVVWETRDAGQYRSAIDALHTEPFFGTPWFEIVDVVSAVEDDADEVEADARMQYALAL